MEQKRTIKVLFVCLGNICRSPSADGIMKQLVREAGLEDRISIDSAGTIGVHHGNPADSRMRQHALQRGYTLDSISRPVVEADFDEFDYIIGMDYNNIADLKARAKTKEQEEKIFAMCSWCASHDHDEVPDPYYGGSAGFELVLDILEDACQNLLTDLQEKLQ